MEDRTLRAMRTMAWERAKGELRSILVALPTEPGEDEARYEKFKRELDDFIDYIEGNGLCLSD